jgi:hypothetical protein
VPGMPARTPAAAPTPEHNGAVDHDDERDTHRRPGYDRYAYAGTYGRGRGYRQDPYDDYDDPDDADPENYLRPVGDPEDDYDDDYADESSDDDEDDGEDGVIWRAATPPAPVAGATSLAPHAVTRPPGTAAPHPPKPVKAPRQADPPAVPGKRVRVVLAERKAAARPVRTVVDLQGDSPVGEALRSGLIVDQMRVALRFALLGGLTLGVLPLLFYVVPELGTIAILGLRLPWLVLGILVYPFLCGLGWWFTRTAERIEQDFADHIQDN